MKKHTLKENIKSLVLGCLVGSALGLLAIYHQRNNEEVITPTVEESSEAIVLESNPIVIYEESSEEISEEIQEVEKIYLGKFKTTAYCSCDKCCGSWADGITYTGTVATEGRTISVDPYVIPLGTVIEIDGIEYVAEDVGGSIKNNRVDIFFNSHEDALNYGVQYHEVYLIEEVE